MTDTDERARAAAKIEAKLRAALASIRDNWAALLEPSSGGGAATPSTDIVTALDKRISLSHEITLVLISWARVVVDKRHLTTGPREEGTLGLITLLERWAPWLADSNAGPACADELADWAHDLSCIVDPPAREWVYLGDCPFVEEDWFCAGQIRAGLEGDGEASCSDCGRTASVEWWEEVLKVGIPPCTTGALVVVIHARLGMRVSDQTVRNWAKNGIISQYDEPFGPAPRWPRWDVRAVLGVVARMGRDCAACGNPWHGQGTICTACFISSRSAAMKHAEPRDPFPTVTVPRRLPPEVVPDVRDDPRPNRCHWSDLIIDQCACGKDGHAYAI